MTIVKPARPEPTPAAKPSPAVAERHVEIRSLVGVMIHPYSGQTFSATPVPVDSIDSWTQSQLDAGKLTLC